MNRFFEDMACFLPFFSDEEKEKFNNARERGGLLSMDMGCKNLSSLLYGGSPINSSVRMKKATLDGEHFTEEYTEKGMQKTRNWDSIFRSLSVPKFSIDRLVVKNSVKNGSISLLKRLASVDVINVILPLNCSKLAKEILQITSDNIIFSKSNNPVKNATISVDGFVDFLAVPVLKVQYEVTEKSINTILKQWHKKERSATRAVYAHRKGKPDKLDVLLDGLHEFSSDINETEMGIFLTMTFPNVAILSVSYTSMSFSVETTSLYRDGNFVKYDENFSPLMNLDNNVELSILKHLEFRDLMNLSRTCRKWFETVSTAPNSVKPTLEFDDIEVDKDNFVGVTVSYEKGLRELRWAIGTPLTFVNRILCHRMTIKEWVKTEEDRDIPWEAFRYLHKHLNRFEIKSLTITFPMFILPSNCYVFLDVCNMAKEVRVDRTEEMKRFTERVPDDYRPCLNNTFTFFTILTTQTVVVNQNPVDIKFVNFVIKQWAEGKRPSLELFYSKVYPIDGNPVDLALSGLEEFVCDRKRDGLYVRIAVPDLPVMSVSVYDTGIKMEKVEE